jgi:hypothetical protein
VTVNKHKQPSLDLNVSEDKVHAQTKRIHKTELIDDKNEDEELRKKNKKDQSTTESARTL